MVQSLTGGDLLGGAPLGEVDPALMNDDPRPPAEAG